MSALIKINGGYIDHRRVYAVCELDRKIPWEWECYFSADAGSIQIIGVDSHDVPVLTQGLTLLETLEGLQVWIKRSLVIAAHKVDDYFEVFLRNGHRFDVANIDPLIPDRKQGDTASEATLDIFLITMEST